MRLALVAALATIYHVQPDGAETEPAARRALGVNATATAAPTTAGPTPAPTTAGPAPVL